MNPLIPSILDLPLIWNGLFLSSGLMSTITAQEKTAMVNNIEGDKVLMAFVIFLLLFYT